MYYYKFMVSIKENKNEIPKPLIMGILNVTPDSFSDGGQYNNLEQALTRSLEMIEQGADIIDIGGESTRPGAESISTAEQMYRVVPVISTLRSKSDVLISVDTTDVEVARAALKAGANWINDVSAGDDARAQTEDNLEPMLLLAAEMNASIVLMHRQGKSATMQDGPVYDDVCLEVKQYLLERAALAEEMGVSRDNIILDPGIGFGKLLEHNLALLADLKSLTGLGYDILLGTSRKRFIGEICGVDEPEQRIAGTCATTALGVAAGVKIFRVHDVLDNKHAAEIAWHIHS